MELTFRQTIENLLKKQGARPLKRLGQNFLIDKNVLKKIIEAAELKPTDIVLEIGPGIGTLTQELAKRVKRVIAVEKDKKMIEILKETLKNHRNVDIIQGDVLKIGNRELEIGNYYKVVANIPYYLTSPLIRKFLEIKNQPELMILMVQKEVSQRICSKPPKMNLLAVSVQFYANPKIISFVSKNSFWPVPKVDSAIIKIKPQINTDKKINTDLFFRIVRAGFSQPRKQLANNLSKGLALSLPNGLKLNKSRITFWLLKNKINPTQRAETLSIEQWIKLTLNFQYLFQPPNNSLLF